MPPESGSTSAEPPSAVMVGRAAELRSALTALTATRGSVLLISGEAGIGKTTLIHAALQRIGRPYLIARAPDDDGTSPYWPWKRLARKLPGVRQALAAAADAAHVVRSEDTAAARFRLHDRVGDALAEAAGTDGLVLVLEDAHLADPASLGLLGHLAGTLDAEPLALVVTFREPGGTTPAWQQVLPRMLRSPALTRIALTGFTPAECAEYVTAATGRNPDTAVLDELMTRTARNPLYLKTMVDLLIRDGRSVRLGVHGAGVQNVASDATGADLTSLVAALVVDLPESTRSLLALASVLEHDISVARLATVSGRPPIEVSASCDAARVAGVVLDDEDGLRFSHAVVRDGIYAGIPATERTRWHRAVAGRLARQLPPGEVAAHWGRGAEDSRSFREAAVWARRAGREAIIAAAPEMAAARCAEGLDWLTRAGADDVDKAEALIDLARAQFVAGDVGGSLSSSERAAELADRVKRPDLLAAAALVVRGIGSPDINHGVDRLVRRAMSSDTGADIAVSARLSAQAARVAMELGRVADARRLANGATALAVSSCDDDATLDAVWAEHRCADPNTELPTVTLLGEQALELARRLRRPIDELFARLILLDASLVGGDLAGYDSGLIALTDLARSQDLVLGWWHVHRSRATRSALQGHFADARRHSAVAHRFAERLGDFSAQAMTGGFSLALAWLRWDPSEIDEVFLQEAVAFSFVPLIDVSLALAQVIQGRPDAARAAFSRHVASVTGYEADYSSLALYLYLGELACAFVDPSGATVVYQLFSPMAEQCGGTHSVFTIGAVALPLARLALTCGRHEQALAHLDVADRLNTRLAARPYLALGKLTRAMILAGRGQPGDRAEARAAVRGAAKEFRALDMPGRLRQAETLADELDAAARANDPLSRREREVAELLADGMSNRAIANRLVLSERTVEQHVRSILAKLGLTSRTQVALWAARDR